MTMRPEDVPADLVKIAVQGLIACDVRGILANAIPEIERRAVEAERAAIVGGIKHYFASMDDPLHKDVRILCERIERGEYETIRSAP